MMMLYERLQLCAHVRADVVRVRATNLGRTMSQLYNMMVSLKVKTSTETTGRGEKVGRSPSRFREDIHSILHSICVFIPVLESCLLL
jgi:hypothetical protein